MGFWGREIFRKNVSAHVRCNDWTGFIHKPSPDTEPVIAAKLTLSGLIHVIQLNVPKNEATASGNTKYNP
jgi:hypothetical protein